MGRQMLAGNRARSGSSPAKGYQHRCYPERRRPRSGGCLPSLCSLSRRCGLRRLDLRQPVTPSLDGQPILPTTKVRHDRVGKTGCVTLRHRSKLHHIGIEPGVAIAEYIEHFYNPARRHRALGYLTPNEFEDLHAPQAKATCPKTWSIKWDIGHLERTTGFEPATPTLASSFGAIRLPADSPKRAARWAISTDHS
jgi:hypothetical protein